jgi:hypothetical protein
MSWKKIIALALFLAILVAAIAYVNQREKAKRDAEGTLLDIPAASVDRIELRSKGKRFVFSRQDTLWMIEEPLKARGDKVTLENILDNFCQLKYDRLVEENARDLKNFGLDDPDIELKLSSKDGPAQTIQLGMKNSLDDSSYSKLATSLKVVSIAAYKRNDLEKDLFAFRDKKFFAIDTMAVTAMNFDYDGMAIELVKKGGQWFMEKPVYSLAQETKVNDILSSASLLEAVSFEPMVDPGTRGAFGLEKPLLTAEFRSDSGLRRIEVGQKDERYYALADGAAEISGINKDFPEKFSGEAASFREKKVALFYAFDAREINYQRGAFRFAARKDSAGNWEFTGPSASLTASAGKKPSEEKIGSLLTALADCAAREFIDGPKAVPAFTTRIALKTEDPAAPEKRNDIVMEFSAADGETVTARNPSLPYHFAVGKEILEKLPVKMEDIAEDAPKAEETTK